MERHIQFAFLLLDLHRYHLAQALLKSLAQAHTFFSACSRTAGSGGLLPAQLLLFNSGKGATTGTRRLQSELRACPPLKLGMRRAGPGHGQGHAVLIYP